MGIDLLVSNEDLGTNWTASEQHVRGVDGEVATKVTARCEMAGQTMGLTSGQTRNLFSTTGWINQYRDCRVLQTSRGMSIIDKSNREIVGSLLPLSRLRHLLLFHAVQRLSNWCL